MRIEPGLSGNRSQAGFAAAVLTLMALLSASPASFSQVLPLAAAATLPSTAASARVSASSPAKVIVSRPSWAELTPAQQQALAPLAPGWSTINEAQKRKWLEISKNYRRLTPEGQATLNSRMTEWVALSPQQRAQARLNFGKTKELARELTPEEKKGRWEAYQALSPEEKQKLAAKASPTPTGAATAVKPVSPQKLAVIPPHPGRPASRPDLKIIPLPAPVSPAGPAAASEASPTPQR